MLHIRLAGADVALHPAGGVWLPEYHTLLVADAHFGKAVSFRKLGVPVPQGTTTETLAQLSRLVADTGARRIVFDRCACRASGWVTKRGTRWACCLHLAALPACTRWRCVMATGCMR
jgi:hypothetical protein